MKKETKKTMAPKLRFAEFREAWESKELGQITTWFSGGTPSKDNPEYWGGEIPWISASSMHGINYSDSKLKLTAAGLKNGSRLAKKGSLLLLVRGSMLFNSVPIGLAGKDVAFNQDLKSIVVSKEVDKKYLLYWFLASEQLLMSMVGGTGIGAGKLETSELQKLFVHLPTLPEQQKIAATLSSLDDLIAAQSEKIKVLQAHKKGLMQRLFPAEGETVPRLRFGEFRDKGEWEEKTLGKICEINPSVGKLPEEFVYIDLESVESGRLLQKKIISLKGAPSRAQRLLKNGDVIFQTVRPYQQNNYFFQVEDGFDYVASTGYAQLRAYQSNAYLFQYLHNDRFVNRVLAKCTGSNYPAINSSDLAEIIVEIPEPAEQQKIAATLSSLDDLIAAQSQKLEALKKHKKGLMQGMFPGSV